MKTRIPIWLMCALALLTWTGLAGTQAATSAPKVQLPNGEAVWDLSGDWEALIENLGPMAGFGTYPNVYRITQTGSAFNAIRLKDIPRPLMDEPGVQVCSVS